MESVKVLLMKLCLLVSCHSISKKSCHRRPLVQVAENDKTVKIRRGYVGIYVGEEAKRYEVPVKYVSFPPFQELMKQSEDDELDFKIDGPIKLSCTPEIFECQILKLAKKF
ncbi:hypothetical protein Patl1_31523 [Pistacia atlantica]|uniref:Uncharacterized protein n=1 Tax=Pistacia atlantica TaxID=434234 RepID=A0ACC1AR04_9ROSI|nr:hypothetical protein Patl1_31523 [Pistacia atlantica]